MAAEVKSLTAGAAESGAAARGPDMPQAVPTSAKTYLVTLPRELILEIIKLCVPPRPLRNTITVNRTITISQLSLVDKSLREMCVPILFRTLKLSTNHVELLGHIQVLENSRILEIVQHLSIVSRASGNATPLWEPSLPPRLATFLGRMPNLKDLNLTLRYGTESLATAVHDELLKQRIIIPAVKNFKYNMPDSMWDPSLSVSFIPAVFTGLCALHLDLGMIATPEEVPGLSTTAPSLKLHTLSLHSEMWFSKTFDQIHELFPNITKLIIGGEVGDVMISESIPTIKKFRNLRFLALTDRISIDEDDLRESLREVREACPCPNCYLTDDMDLVCAEDEESEGVCGCVGCSFTRGHYGEALDLARVDHPLAEDQKENVRGIFRECPNLGVLYFQITWAQGTRYRPVRDNTGRLVRIQYKEAVDWPGISKELAEEDAC
ncbi:hypothetical protein CGLO_16450 [Colletotrichum gloeosporioides Cg-14]|uniref:Uncharacterized protein n=1 Tax=Colletotrichum gloeosporioides (strain Cg-14) TaxID=1237896 RepID=T0L998_COLGC|nr:hypothetical protein CGLO_16450 [Colletotrichum gloeosporioides Cg-14]